MIKHYDRFIGGHDSAAINHSATSNMRGGGRGGGGVRSLTTMSHPRRLRFSRPETGEENQGAYSERYSARREEGVSHGVRGSCAGPVK